MLFRAPGKAVRLPLLLSLLWCLFMVGLYQRGNAEKDAHTNELALTQARTLYAQVLDTRSWNAAHGGVYVPESAYGAPNPWIPEAQRTLKLADGQRLVLMNPAYMSRQIGELSSVKGTSFRITSHKPLRPENASDAWETEALSRCVGGAGEVFALFRDGESPRYRYLSALYAQKDCLSCHAGSVVGEVRGGISVSLDARPFLQSGQDQERNLRWAFGLMGLTGVLGIGGTSYLAQRRRMLAEERERMKSAFLANMSHDMRTPLTGIMGMADLLERPQSEGQKREALRYLQLAGAALLEMVSDITDYAALDAGQVALSERPFDVRAVLQRCLDIFQPQCRAKGLYLRLRVADDVPVRVTGDEFRLRQALGNLISNAVKFTDSGGISVTVSRGALVPDKGAGLGAAPGTARGAGSAAESTGGSAQDSGAAAKAGPLCVVRFAVEDTGVGIAVQDQRRIFERFERGSASSQGYGGTGLGLSIAQDIALLMGGTLDVQSQPGQGACFTLSLRFAISPALAEHRAEGADAAHAAPVSPTSPTPPMPPMSSIPSRSLSSSVACGTGATGYGASPDTAQPDAAQPDTPSLDAALPERAASLAHAAHAAPAAAGGASVLVGEDNAVTLHYLEQVLSDAGYAVRTAGDGEQVLELFAAHRPDLVVLDMRMPGLDGLQTARALRGRPGPAVPIVVLSASVSAEERTDFAALGVQAHLLKPVPAQDLLREVAAALGAASRAFSSTQAAQAVAQQRAADDLFDRNAALQDLDGDAGLLCKLAELWLAEVPERRAELLRALAPAIPDAPSPPNSQGSPAGSAGPATVQRVAHGWKNSAAVLHLCQLHALCGQLEKAPAHEYPDLVPRVLRAVEEAANAVRTVREHLPPAG